MLLITLFVMTVVAVHGQTVFRVCTATNEEQAFCVSKALPIMNAGTAALKVQFECVQRASDDECMVAIQQDQADWRTFDGGDLYKSYKQHGLVFVVSEQYSDSPPAGGEYYSVAVVRSDFCTSTTTLKSLEGLDACVTGYRRSAGWGFPIGAMLQKKVMTPVARLPNVHNDAETAAAFFDGVCAARVSDNGPVMTADGAGATWPDLCELCKGNCSITDDYYNYAGAMRCLQSGSGQVAFVKHTSPAEFALGGTGAQSWSTLRASQMSLVCSGLDASQQASGCAPITDYEKCNFGLVPAHAVAVRPNYVDRDLLKNALLTLNASAPFRALVFNTSSNPSDYLFKAGTTELLNVTETQEEFLGSSVLVYQQILDLDAVKDTTTSARICTISAEEQAFCAEVAAVLNDGSYGVTFTCVEKASDDECIAAIASNMADMRTFDSGDLYAAYKKHQLSFIVAENYGEDESGLEYYAVAVVRSNMCDSGTTLASLKGKNACHTGYRRSAGWNFPVGLMIEAGVMSVESSDSAVENDAESVAAFFNKVCAARVYDNGPVNSVDGVGTTYPGLCDLCQGGCTDSSLFYGYEGALKCMLEGGGDVAFVKHTTVLNTTAPVSLICGRQGTSLVTGCKAVSEYKTCNVGRVPSHAVAVRPGYTGAAQLSEALVRASSNPAFKAKVFTVASNPKDYVFKYSTKSLEAILVSASEFLGDAVVALDGYELLTSAVRICTVKEQEHSFCEQQVAPMLNGLDLGMAFSCVMRDTEDECLSAISSGAADWRAYDGQDLYRAHTLYALDFLVAEDYSGDGTTAEYYSVAIVNKDLCTDSTTLESLRGKDSCHTGYKRSAGWSYPVGLLTSTGVMSTVAADGTIQNDAESVAAFFGKTCAGRVSANGPVKTADGKGSTWDELCEGCKTNCTVDDEYYDYSGAFRCLMEGAGQVAFTKHTIPLEFAKDGTAPAAWATKGMDEFRLVCGTQNGKLISGCNTVDQAASCHISPVPAHAVVVRSNWDKSSDLQQALLTAAKTTKFQDLLFSAVNNPTDYVFKQSAKQLIPITVSNADYLGSALDAFRGVELMSYDVSAPAPAPAPAPGSTSLSAGAVAGIGIGCAVAGMLIGAGVMILIRNRASKKSYGNFQDTQFKGTNGV